MVKSKIIRIGNSLGITIPSRLIKSMSLQAGDTIELTQDNAASITVFFKASKQMFLDNLGIKNTLKKPL
jgi:antitoxin component of MazEF toxin-antitoxin module